ncbi:hypothetical protein KMZ32_06085 [Phycicoccus sp. MAQZ13P-2]|uniref:hypothetical protein n=1 Tax=Phycicoccus mangrovi TaxID=2840470 RepID=UPI001C000D6B|nr:hypothetical protein [Phycicoccus mangrovi]MBT9273642.1 hypothetical protein [Phycicoccus mangrovi]
MDSKPIARTAYLVATLHTAGVRLPERLTPTQAQRDERGASTLEIVFWAVALLLLAGIVYAALTAYINGKLPGIR